MVALRTCSLSTGVHYETKDGDEALYLEIMDFFCKVFNNGACDYTLGRLASFLSGRCSHEHFTSSRAPDQRSGHPSSCSRHRRYCCKLPTALLTQSRAAAGSARRLARTRARRWLSCRSLASSERLNVGRHEGVSGGDTIICRAQ
jgi:hypothetical protein